MSRRRRVIHKEEKIDARYGSPLVARLIGTIMKSGQRQLAERVAYEAIEESRQGSEAVDPLECPAIVPPVAGPLGLDDQHPTRSDEKVVEIAATESDVVDPTPSVPAQPA